MRTIVDYYQATESDKRYSKKAFMPVHDINWPTELHERAWAEGKYAAGSTDPWSCQLLASLVSATNSRKIIEFGTLDGLTALWLAVTLERMGGGVIYTVDVAQVPYEFGKAVKNGYYFANTSIQPMRVDALDFIRGIEEPWAEFVWLDDDHDPAHVRQELDLLIEKAMLPGGFIAMHDMQDPELKAVCLEYGGMIIPTRAVHVGSGIGLIRIPSND